MVLPGRPDRELARACEAQLSYGIGRPQPISIQARGFGASRLDDDTSTSRVAEVFDFRLGGILRALALRRLAAGAEAGFFEHLATHGQMGREDPDLPWGKTDRAGDLSG